MKASKIAVKDTFVHHVKDASGAPMYEPGPDGKPEETKPVEITVYGPGSKQYRKAKAEQQNRLVALVQKRGRQAKTTAESQMREGAEFLADVTHSIRYLEEDDAEGNPLTGRDLALAIYSNPALGFIADQVNEEVHRWENFSQASPTI
jgi:hypothetical protein